MKLFILPDENVRDFYENGVKNHNRENAGFDLYCPRDISIPANSIGEINHEIKCEVIWKRIEDDNVAYLLMPRSSISNTPLMMCNSIGLIDAGYRGYIIAKVRNFSNEAFEIKRGTRLFQLVPINNGFGWDSVNIVETLSSSNRGEGGFGSTGK